jgi:prephenate dehydratase
MRRCAAGTAPRDDPPRRQAAHRIPGRTRRVQRRSRPQAAGRRIDVLPCPRFEDVFRSLQEGAAAGAVIPIENTLAGSVHENYDHLQRYEFPIVAETNVRIVHNLMAPPGVPFSRIRRVYSHPVALNQCLDFFARHPRIEKMTTTIRPAAPK